MTKRQEPVVLTVDPTVCSGLGMCAVVAPELVELDEWGYPIVPDHAVVDDLARAARRAARACPRRALSAEVPVKQPPRLDPPGGR